MLTRWLTWYAVVFALVAGLAACVPPSDEAARPPRAAPSSIGDACGDTAGKVTSVQDAQRGRYVLLVDATADQLPLALPSKLRADISAKAEAAYTFSIGVIHGSARSDRLWRQLHLGIAAPAARKDNQSDDAAVVADCVAALAEQVTATVPGTDVLGAIQGAVDELRSGQLQATAPPTLAVVSNGLANTGALDLRQAFSGDASPKEVVHMLRATHDLPDLRGIHVDFYQLAQTTSEPFQQRRNRDWLESVWGAICADARAVRCEMNHEPAQRTGPRRTTPQDFRFWAPKPPEPDCLQAPTRCDLPSVLLFDPGSHQLRAGADGILRPIADRLRRTSERALVKGHTASWGSPAYRLDLSRRRASAVVERLVKLGVQHQQLRSTGVGSRERVANDLGPGGRLVEPQASRNRRVELVFQR